MATDTAREYKELTSDHLYATLSQLSENVEADSELLKRSACRWLLRAPAELHIPAPDGTDQKEYVSLRDISMTGVGVLCKKPVKVGMAGHLVLPLEDGYYKVDLRIAHCTQTVGGYKVGALLMLPDAPTMVPMISHAMLTHEEFERNSR